MTKSGDKLPSAEIITFPALSSAHLFHGVFNRHGGVSPKPWLSKNISFGVGDTSENVYANRARLKKALNFDRLVSAKQVHSTKVHIVEECPAEDLEIEGCDALITNVQGPGLMIQQADCQAVFLFDPQKKAVAMAHVGWRGSVENILGITVAAMFKAYATEPAALIAAISPSLGPCCAEFMHYYSELPVSLHSYKVRPDYFDFRAISRDQLRSAGLRPENIHITEICTCCNQDYFSYRREGETGRFASVIGLKQEEGWRPRELL